MKAVYKESIPYLEKGVDKELEVNIRSVSNRSSEEYTALMQDIEKFKALVEKEAYLLSESGTMIADLTEYFKKNLKADKEGQSKLKENEKAREDLRKEIIKYNSSDIFKRRVNLIISILTHNMGEDLDKKYYTFDFWNEHVESFQMMRFLVGCVCKDIEEAFTPKRKKKKKR